MFAGRHRRELKGSAIEITHAGTESIVIFDLDNTLILNPFMTGVFPHIQRVFSEAGEKKDYIRELQTESIRLRRAGRLVESYNWDLICSNVAYANHINVKISVKKVVEEYNKPPFISLEPGTKELLQSLHESNHKIVILTNGYEEYQLPVVKSLGLEEYDAFISAEKIGYIKPQPEAFELAAKPFLKHDRQKPIVVGDSLLFDVWGASIAGYRAIWRNKDQNDPRTVIRLSDLSVEIRQAAEKEGLASLVKCIPRKTVPVATNLYKVNEEVKNIEASSHNEL